jgi:hypothetical protein
LLWICITLALALGECFVYQRLQLGVIVQGTSEAIDALDVRQIGFEAAGRGPQIDDGFFSQRRQQHLGL